MKHNLLVLLSLLALLFALQIAPAYADDKEPPPPCSQCDGREGGYWG